MILPMTRWLLPLALAPGLGSTLLSTSAEESPPSIEDLLERIRPSVVTVFNASRTGEQNGVGSGFFIGEGLVVTNLHVTGEGRPIRVKLSDGSEPKVTAMHAWDRKRDLAILKVDASAPALQLNEESVRQGAEALAVGNPQGLEFSVTRGIVSALREVDDLEMIQVAVPIERGNSGGPLLNRMGQAIGVLTLKSAVTENLGFAMPAESVQALLDQPNTVSIEHWLKFGVLNPKLWEPIPSGADWRQRTGAMTVQGAGSGFGGRALCLSKLDVPELPYEIALEVKLNDESGAAGIAFGSDGGDRHYGFYPTNGQMRLTRFDGPTVYSWNILEQVVSPHYKPDEFNRLRVRVEAKRVLCYLNGHLVIESNDHAWRTGQTGLCKFRTTEPEYRRFAVGKDLSQQVVLSDAAEKAIAAHLADPAADPAQLAGQLSESPEAARVALFEKAKSLEAKAEELKIAAKRLHGTGVQRAMIDALSAPEDEIDLLRAALLVAKLDAPELVIDDYLREVDHMASQVEARIAAVEAGKGDTLSERQRLELLGSYMFEENGFHGSRSDYYNPSNSYLNHVIDYREGIPITLSVVYMELARRINLKVIGVPLPGHFVTKHIPSRTGFLPQLVDAYDRGTFLSEEEAAAIVARVTGDTLKREHLEPATKGQIIVRMLRNLMGIAINSDHPPSALPYLNLIIAIHPDEPQDHLSRAILLVQAERPSEAKADIDWLLEHEPAGMDLNRLREWRSTLGD